MHSEFEIRKVLYRAGSFVYNENLFTWWLRWHGDVCRNPAYLQRGLTYELTQWKERI